MGKNKGQKIEECQNANNPGGMNRKALKTGRGNTIIPGTRFVRI